MSTKMIALVLALAVPTALGCHGKDANTTPSENEAVEHHAEGDHDEAAEHHEEGDHDEAGEHHEGGHEEGDHDEGAEHSEHGGTR